MNETPDHEEADGSEFPSRTTYRLQNSGQNSEDSDASEPLNPDDPESSSASFRRHRRTRIPVIPVLCALVVGAGAVGLWNLVSNHSNGFSGSNHPNEQEQSDLNRLREENRSLTENVHRLQQELDEGFRSQGEKIFQYEEAQKALVSLRGEMEKAKMEADDRHKVLLGLNEKWEKENQQFRAEVAGFQKQLEEREAAHRAQRRLDLVDKELGTLLLDGKSLFETQVVQLDAVSVQIRHKYGIDRVLLERLPDRLQKALVYDPAEARAFSEKIREKRAEASVDAQKVRQNEAARAETQAALVREGEIKKRRAKLKGKVTTIQRSIEQWKNAPAKGAAISRNRQKVESLQRDLYFAERELAEFERGLAREEAGIPN